MILTEQLTARVKARRVVENLLWVQHFARLQKPGPVDTRLVRIVAAWFCDQWETRGRPTSPSARGRSPGTSQS